MGYEIYVVAVFTMIFSILLGERLSKKLSEKESGEINGDNIHPLNKDRLFLAVVFCSLFLSVDIAIIISLESLASERYVVGLSGESFLIAFDLFKAPISILGAGFAVAALIATIHRSRETNIQIHKTNQQIQKADHKNTFENYIKHRDEVIKDLAIFDDAFLVKKLNLKSIVYSRIFKENFFDKMSYRISKEDNDKYVDHLDSFNSIFISESDADKVFFIINIYSRVIGLFNVEFTDEIKVEINGESYKFPTKSNFSSDNNENNKVFETAILNGLALSSALIFRTIITGGGKGEYQAKIEMNNIFKGNIYALVNSNKYNVHYKT